MPQALITRPYEDAISFKEALGKMGISSIIHPMFSIRMLDKEINLDQRPDLIAFTSSNGVRAFSRLSKERNIPTFTVGDTSARECKSHGFKNVFSAQGNIDNLANVIADTLPKNSLILHISGSDIAGDLEGILKKSGYRYCRLILYRAEEVENLSPDLITSIKDNKINIATFFSPRTVRIFCKLILKNNLEKHLKYITSFCLSETVYLAFNDIKWKAKYISPYPTQESIIEIIRTYSEDTLS